jgi:hypothetical protein
MSAGSPLLRVAPVHHSRSYTAVTTPAGAVQRFYDAINRGDYNTAYSLLSPGFRGTMSLSTFRKGYSTTQSVEATTRDVGGGVVNVALTAVDRNEDGTTRTTRYSGYWKVISTTNGMLLDDGRFHTAEL